MTAPRLVLSQEALAAMEAEARAAVPREACGLLIGTRDAGAVRVASVVPSPNAAPLALQAQRFEIEPALLLRLHRELRGSGQDIVGLYHSHPNGRAGLSATDRAEAWTPGLAWLVFALTRGEITGRAAFLHVEAPGDARFVPMEIEIVAQP